MRSLSLLAAGLVCAMLLSDASAQTPKDSPNNPAAIRKVLDQRITLDYNGQSFNDTLEHLRQKTKLNIIMDPIVMQQYGIFPPNVGGPGGFGGGGGAPFPGNLGGGGPVLLKIENGKVRAALQKLLNMYQLTFVILDDSVLITSEEVGQLRQMKQRVSIEIKEQPLAEVLKKLDHDTGVNVLIDPRLQDKAKAKITLQLENVTLETAVRLLTELADLGAVNVGNVLFVTSTARADKMRQENQLNSNNPLFPGGLPAIQFGRVGAAAGFGGAGNDGPPPPPIVVAPAPPKKGN